MGKIPLKKLKLCFLIDPIKPPMSRSPVEMHLSVITHTNERTRNISNKQMISIQEAYHQQPAGAQPEFPAAAVTVAQQDSDTV